MNILVYIVKEYQKEITYQDVVELEYNISNRHSLLTKVMKEDLKLIMEAIKKKIKMSYFRNLLLENYLLELLLEKDDEGLAEFLDNVA